MKIVSSTFYFIKLNKPYKCNYIITNLMVTIHTVDNMCINYINVFYTNNIL